MKLTGIICLAVSLSCALAHAEQEPSPAPQEQAAVSPDELRDYLQLCTRHNGALLSIVSRVRDASSSEKSLRAEFGKLCAEMPELQRKGDAFAESLAGSAENPECRELMSTYRHSSMEQLSELRSLLAELWEQEIPIDHGSLVDCLIALKIPDDEMRHEDTVRRYEEYAVELLRLYRALIVEVEDITNAESAATKLPALQEITARAIHSMNMLRAYIIDDPEGAAHSEQAEYFWGEFDVLDTALFKELNRISAENFYGIDELNRLFVALAVMTNDDNPDEYEADTNEETAP